MHKEFHPKSPSQNIPPTEFIPKIFQRTSPKNSKKFPPKIQKDFENFQFPTLHLQAKNPFGLVFFLFPCSKSLPKVIIEKSRGVRFLRKRRFGQNGQLFCLHFQNLLTYETIIYFKSGRGASEKVSAVCFCLGSGLFGSCNSD
jgi:hypothetical protein